jgi:5-hydroxyisourate hydrolase
MEDGMEDGGKISLHAVDVAAGRPARGMAVELWRLEPDRRRLAEGVLRDNGTFETPSAGVGQYEAVFHLGAHFRAVGAVLPDPPFLDVAVFRFGIADAGVEYHLPLKFTPWGFSLFRGA